MAPQQVARIPAYQALADDLRTQITNGTLRPGQRLPTEPQLCVQYGMSRSTVREALRLLASQNLVVTTRGVTGGSFVSQPSPIQIAESLSTGMHMLLASGSAALRDLIELGEVLEIPAAELAARRRTDEDLDRIGAELFDPAVDDQSRLMEMHGRFHMAIAAATGNLFYEVVSRPLYAHSQALDVIEPAPRWFWAQLDLDHRRMLAAIRDRDPERAAEVARRHLDRISAGFSDELYRLGKTFTPSDDVR